MYHDLFLYRYLRCYVIDTGNNISLSHARSFHKLVENSEMDIRESICVPICNDRLFAWAKRISVYVFWQRELRIGGNIRDKIIAGANSDVARVFAYPRQILSSFFYPVAFYYFASTEYIGGKLKPDRLFAMWKRL